MKKNNIIRYTIVASMLIFIVLNSFLHTTLGSNVIPGIHAICPYGAVEGILALIFTGTFIKNIFLGTFVLLGITLIIALLFRRAFCGYLCPFGAMQEFFGMLGRKIFKRQLVVNPKIDKPLRWLKYIVLVLTIVMAWKTSEIWVSNYDPYSALAHIFSPEELIQDSLIGFILLIVTIIGSIVYDRFFCKYLCPAGALFGILSKVGLTKIKRDKDICIGCNKCSKVCPVNIDVAKLDEVKTAECINCNKCVNECPKKGALEIKTVNNKKVSVFVYSILVLVIFFGGIIIASLNGIYIVKNSAIKSGGLINQEIIEQNEVNIEQKQEVTISKYDVSLIKGSTTLNELIVGMKISKDELYAILGIDSSIPTNTKIKDMETYVEGMTPEVIRNKIDPNYISEEE